MKVTLYHNCKCSKSRATLQILEQNNIEPDIVNYLENPPTLTELETVIRKLNIEPKQLIRFKEARAQELGISQSDERPDTEWLSLILENPILMERPIVVTSDKAAIGRPPENVLSILK